MKRIEKAKELMPDLSEEEIIFRYCPSDILDNPETWCKKTCEACWNEEYE